MTIPGVLPLHEVRARPPLALLEAMVAGAFPQAPLGVTLGFRLSAIAPGHATFTAEPASEYLNPMGTVHGGWTASVLDSAMGCAVLSTVAAGEIFTTLELKVNFARAIKADGGALTAAGSIIARGRRVVTAEARMTDAAGRLVAHATSTCMIVPVDAPPA